TIELDEQAQTVCRKSAALALVVEGIRFQKEPMVFYEVYVNLPANEKPDYQSAHYAGNLIFAGVDSCAHARHHALRAKGQHKEAEAARVDSSRAFDISDNVRELRARGLWHDRQLTVTFVMNGLVPVNNAARTGPGLKAQFESARLVGR